LENELREAVNSENYEEAAVIGDTIHSLKEKAEMNDSKKAGES
jgi:protein-arginine kinase activator protein McsA